MYEAALPQVRVLVHVDQHFSTLKSVPTHFQQRTLQQEMPGLDLGTVHVQSVRSATELWLSPESSMSFIP